VQPAVADTQDEIIGGIAAGDRSALADLYARYERPLFAYLRYLTADVHLAEELLQDTLLAVWRGADGFHGQSSIQSWLFGIARRRVHDAMRRRTLHLVDETALETLLSHEPEPEDLAVAQAERDEVTAAIARLEPIHREVLLLTFVNELSYQEQAEVLGVPLGTVKSRLCNAKRALRTLLLACQAGEARP
jgi:RNA polymerase sigma-70 factor (ECF subfamily)